MTGIARFRAEKRENIIRNAGVRQKKVRKAPHEEEEVRCVKLVVKPDALKQPIVVSRIGYERMSARQMTSDV
jgi:hypothetical protein